MMSAQRLTRYLSGVAQHQADQKLGAFPPLSQTDPDFWDGYAGRRFRPRGWRERWVMRRGGYRLLCERVANGFLAVDDYSQAVRAWRNVTVYPCPRPRWRQNHWTVMYQGPQRLGIWPSRLTKACGCGRPGPCRHDRGRRKARTHELT